MSRSPSLCLKINPAKPRVRAPSPEMTSAFNARDLVLSRKKGLENWPASISEVEREHLSSEVHTSRPKSGKPVLLNFLNEDRSKAFCWAQERDLVLLEEQKCRKWLGKNGKSTRLNQNLIGAWQQALAIICARPDWQGTPTNVPDDSSTSSEGQQDEAYNLSEESESDRSQPTRTSLRVTLISRKPPKPTLRSATRPKTGEAKPRTSTRSSMASWLADHEEEQTIPSSQPIPSTSAQTLDQPVPSTSGQTLDLPAQEAPTERLNARKRQKLRLATAKPSRVSPAVEEPEAPAISRRPSTIQLPDIDTEPKLARRGSSERAREANGHFAKKAKPQRAGFGRKAVADEKPDIEVKKEPREFSVDVPAELGLKRKRPPASTSSVASTSASTSTLSPALSSPMFNAQHTTPASQTSNAASVRALLNSYSPSLGDRTHTILAEAGLVTTDDIRMFASQARWMKFIEKTLKGKVSPAVEFLLVECLETFFGQELD